MRIYVDTVFPASVQRVFTQLISRSHHEIAASAADAQCTLSPETLHPPLRLTDIAALFSPTTPAAPLPLAHGWQLVVANRTIQHPSHAPLHLTERECLLLRYLLARTGNEVSQEALMHDVWHYGAEAQSHTLETHIYRLRQKLEAASPAPCSIETTDSGYLLLVNS